MKELAPMPTIGSYGYGDYTPLKVAHFGDLIRAHLKIVQQVYANNHWCDHTYRFFDLTAGPGVHPQDGSAQSPLVYVNAIREMMFPHRSYFFERDQAAFASLAETLRGVPGCHCVCADHRRELLPRVADSMPINRDRYYGLVYYDVTPCAEQFDTLRLLAELTTQPRFGRIDFLIYASAAVIKRLRAHADGSRLSTILRGFQKRLWLVRDTFDSQHQWTFLLGTNWNGYKAYPKLRLFRLDEEEGQAIYARLEMTERERKEEQAGRGLLPFPVGG